jgi:hypothetical protein
MVSLSAVIDRLRQRIAPPPYVTPEEEHRQVEMAALEARARLRAMMLETQLMTRQMAQIREYEEDQ